MCKLPFLSSTLCITINMRDIETTTPFYRYNNIIPSVEYSPAIINNTLILYLYYIIDNRVSNTSLGECNNIMYIEPNVYIFLTIAQTFWYTWVCESLCKHMYTIRIMLDVHLFFENYVFLTYLLHYHIIAHVHRSIHDMFGHSETKPRLDLNPLTTNVFRWKSYIPSSNTITVMPILCNNPSNFPLDCDDNNSSDGEIDESRIDYSTLSNVDPDTNFIQNDTPLNCNYYTESEFNATFPPSEHFSIYHVNIRSLPRIINKLEYYLEEINLAYACRITIWVTFKLEDNLTVQNVENSNASNALFVVLLELT